MFEYKVEAFTFVGASGTSLLEQFAAQLNAQAQAGWEYVGVAHLEGGSGLTGEQLEVNLGGQGGATSRAQVMVFRRLMGG